MNNWIPAIKVSLFITLWATLITSILGTYIGYCFSRPARHKSLRLILETLLTLPMVLPPSIVGYGLLLVLGKNGPLSHFFRINLAFTVWSAVIAAFIVSLPLMIQNAKSAFKEINPLYDKIGVTLGANPKQLFWKVRLPLASSRLFAGVVLSFARALGEFGATLMVAGNIPGRTQTIPLAIYFSVESGDLAIANILTAVVVCISFFALWVINKLTRPCHEEVDHA